MKTALITGATRGIGLATVKALLEDGYKVIGTYVSSDKRAEELQQELENLTLVQSDSGSEKDIEELVDLINSKFGQLDVLVNNVGIDIFAPMTTYKLKDWDKMMNVNLRSYFLLTQKLIPLLEKSKIKSVVNITSRLGMPERAKSPYIMYGITKAGVSVLTKGFAQEFGADGIRVNAVVPPATNTDLLKEVVSEEVWNRIKKSGDMAEPEEVAELVMKLVNDKSAQGQILFDKRVA